MHKIGQVAIIATAVLLFLGAATPAGAQIGGPVNKVGLVAPISEATMDAKPAEIRDRLEAAGFDSNVEFSLFVNRTGSQEILVSKREMNVSYGAFGAYKIPTPSLPADHILYFDDTASTLSGEAAPARLSDFENEPGAWMGNIVEMQNVHVTSVSWELESDAGLTYQQSVSAVGGGEWRSPTLLRAVRNTSLGLGRTDLTFDVVGHPITGAESPPVISLAFGKTSWWTKGEANLQMGIIQEYGSKTIGVRKSMSVRGEGIRPTAETLQSRVGDVVSITTNAVGARTSVRDTLVKASSCPPDMVGQAGNCVPAVADVTLHTGVLATESEVIAPYFGLNNEHLGRISEPYAGRYEIVGRVLSPEEVDPRIESPVVIQVYDLRRVGSISPSDSVQHRAKVLKTTLIEQLTMPQDRWRNVSSKHADRDADTPTPQSTVQPGTDASSTSVNTPSAQTQPTTPGGSGDGFTIISLLAAIGISIKRMEA